MLTPIQRIPRYALLLEQLAKKIPANSPAHSAVANVGLFSGNAK
jgi:hypothetical protein